MTVLDADLPPVARRAAYLLCLMMRMDSSLRSVQQLMGSSEKNKEYHEKYKAKALHKLDQGEFDAEKMFQPPSATAAEDTKRNERILE